MICIAGKNDIAVNVLKFIIEEQSDNKNIVVLLNKNDDGKHNFQKSLKRTAEDLNIKICHDIKELYDVESLIFFSLEYDRIIDSERFISNNLFNIHFSLLPEYKGVYTSALPILNGKDYSGVTLHKIDPGIDTGDIIDQIQFDIEEKDTARVLYHKYLEKSLILFKRNFNKIINNEYFAKPQGPINSTYFSRKSIDYKNLAVDLKQTAFTINNQIRAFVFREFQIPKVNDKYIYKVKILSSKSNKKPGTIINSTIEKLTLSTIDYDCALYIDYLDDLLKCCANNNVHKLKAIIDLVPNIHEKNKHGWSPIIVAAYYNNLEIVQLLFEKGANINDTNYSGTSVLMYAKDGFLNSGSKDDSLLKFLIKNGANISHKDMNEKSVIDYIDHKNNNLLFRLFQV